MPLGYNSMKLIGERIYIRILTPADVSDAYVSWLNDDEITQFLELRWRAHTFDDVKKFVALMNESAQDHLFGIFLRENGRHIGNIKIGDINNMHRFGDVGLLIGDKKMWGKGYGAEAIKLATDYGFRELGLNSLKAGMYEGNTGSYKAFIKAGYKDAGRYRKHRFCNGRYVDELLVEKNREDADE